MTDTEIFHKLLPMVLLDRAAAKVYNPIFCHGSREALKAAEKQIEKVISETLLDVKVIRIDGPDFLNRIMHSLKEGGDIFRFAKSCGGGDILILSGLEEFAGKELASECLYYILDDYLLRGHAIIAFAQTPPIGIVKLAPRIRAQLEGGILLDLGTGPGETV